MLNANKRSVTINIKSAQGQEALMRLIAASDVMVENFGAGVLDRQGITWERISALNPRLIYASIKGFADESGVDAKAYETIAQAMGGAMSTTAGAPARPPPPARRLAIPAPASIAWRASSPPSTSAPSRGAASGWKWRCRTA